MHNLESRLEVGFGADSVRAGVWGWGWGWGWGWVWVWVGVGVGFGFGFGFEFEFEFEFEFGRLWHRRVFALRSKDLNCELRID
jgi:hypothetical protein